MKIAQIADRVGWCSFVFILLNWNFQCWFRLTCRKCNAKIYFRFLLFAAASDNITLHKNVESILTKMICSLASLPIFRWLCFDFTHKMQKTLPFHSMRCCSSHALFVLSKIKTEQKKSCFVQQTKKCKYASSKIKMAFLSPSKNRTN